MNPRPLALALALAPLAAAAQPAPAAPPPPRPRILHAPVGLAENLRPIPLRFELRHPEHVERVTVSWRVGSGAWRTANAARDESAWRAEIPAQPMGVRAVEYHVTLVAPGGERIAAFATPERPHVVVLRPDDDDEQERRDLRASRGNRLEFLAGGEFTDFGARPNPEGRNCGEAAGDACRDRWYLLYGQVRYRFHRRVRSVAVRVERLDGVTTRVESGAPRTRDVGLVSATTEVEFRLLPWVTLAVQGILGANEISVQGGGGARLEIGTTHPARVQLSVQAITSYGVLGSAWMRWDTAPSTPLGAGVEVTTQPGANADAGVRLLVEVGRHFGRRVTVTLRGGYGARREDAGGFTGGASAQLAF